MKVSVRILLISFPQSLYIYRLMLRFVQCFYNSYSIRILTSLQLKHLLLIQDQIGYKFKNPDLSLFLHTLFYFLHINL